MAWEWEFRKMKWKACAGTPRLPKTATQLPSSASECSTSKAQEFRRTKQKESSGCASPRNRAMLPVSSGLELRITLAQASQRIPPKLCVGIARQATKATQRLNTTLDRLTT